MGFLFGFIFARLMRMALLFIHSPHPSSKASAQQFIQLLPPSLHPQNGAEKIPILL
jgi:hypothetical protein